MIKYDQQDQQVINFSCLICCHYLVLFGHKSNLRSLCYVYIGAQNYLMDLGAEFIERRMDLETMDYSEVGANPGHNPNTPPGTV